MISNRKVFNNLKVMIISYNFKIFKYKTKKVRLKNSFFNLKIKCQ